MTVNELREHLATFDGEMIVEIGDSTYPTEELEEVNIFIQNGKILLY